MHRAESPEAISKREPNAGAVTPLVARHTISLLLLSMMAAPVAPVARQAWSAISLRTISSAKSAESSGDSPPPFLVAKLAASSVRFEGVFATVAEPARSPDWVPDSPIAGEADFKPSETGRCTMAGRLRLRSVSVAEFRPKRRACQHDLPSTSSPRFRVRGAKGIPSLMAIIQIRRHIAYGAQLRPCVIGF